MSQRLTDRILKTLPAPAKGNKIHYDSEIKGFGLRITAADARCFILNYRVAGRERRLTIGPYGRDQWTLARARKRAGELRRMVNNGDDPLGKRIEARTAPTVATVLDRFVAEHVRETLKPKTAAEYERLIKKVLKPHLGNHKIEALEPKNVSCLSG